MQHPSLPHTLVAWATPATPFAGAPFDRRFCLSHGWLPLLAFAVLVTVLMLADGDRWLADRLYAWEGHRWAWRDATLTAQVIHLQGRELSPPACLGVLAAWWRTRLRPTLAHWQQALLYLLIAVPLASLLVVWLKSWSNMDCPWDLLRYGGKRPYVGLLAMRPVGLSRGACFPAGHASAGYAWLALYFALRMGRPSWRGWGLAIGLGAGALFGISQQLRGAHFLSHDVWTAAICWFSALGLYRLMGAGDVAEATSAPALDQFDGASP